MQRWRRILIHLGLVVIAAYLALSSLHEWRRYQETVNYATMLTHGNTGGVRSLVKE